MARLRQAVFYLAFAVFLTTFSTASPAFEVVSGELEMNGNAIKNTGFISTGTALSDGNISDSITVGSSGSVDTGALSGTVTNNVETGFLTTSTALSDGNVSNSITITSSGSVDAGAVSGSFSDGQVADTITIDGGFVNVGTQLSDGNISDSVTAGRVTGFVSASPGLTGGNLSSGAVDTTQLAPGAVTEASNVLAGGSVNSTAVKDSSLTTSDLSFNTATQSELVDAQDSAGDVATDVSDLKFTASNDAAVSVTSSSGVATVDYSVSDTNASTECSGSDYLAGDGTCQPDSDTTYSAGNGLELSGTRFDLTGNGVNSTYLDMGAGLVDDGTGQVAVSAGDAEVADTISIRGGFVSVPSSEPLSDGNLSDSITVGSSGTVNTGALSGTVTNDVESGFVSTSTALSDGNVSDSITVSSSGSVDASALTGTVTNDVNASFISTSTALSDGNVSNGISYQASGLSSGSFADADIGDALTISGSGSVNASALSGVVADGDVSDSITISSSGSVDTGALTGTVTNDVEAGFVTTGTPLVPGNLSFGSSGGLKSSSGNLAVEPADFDGSGLGESTDSLSVNTGTGLETSSDSVRISTGAAGNGLTGGGGSALAVADGSGITVGSSDVSVNAGTGVNITNDAVAVDLASIAGTDLSTSSNQLNVQESQIGHGNLANLSSDDHTQYLERDGTDTMSGDLDMGGFNVTNTDATDYNDVTDSTGGNTCAAGNEGQVVYNGTHHLGCDGSNWNALY